MDSARSYHASKTSVRRFEITDYQAGLTDVSTKGQKTPNGEDTTEHGGTGEHRREHHDDSQRLAESFAGIFCQMGYAKQCQ